MPKEITTEEYRALAELRYRIRKFVREGDAVASAAGLEPQQYLLLLAIRGLPEGEEATIRALADRLALKHHSAVELIDGLEAHGYGGPRRGRDDRRPLFGGRAGEGGRQRLAAGEPQPRRPQARIRVAAAAGRKTTRTSGAAPHQRIARERRGLCGYHQCLAGKRPLFAARERR